MIENILYPVCVYGVLEAIKFSVVYFKKPQCPKCKGRNLRERYDGIICGNCFHIVEPLNMTR